MKPKLNLKPDEYFFLFYKQMEYFSEFKRSEIADTNFIDYEHNGMHNPPGKNRDHSVVKKRTQFEAGFADNGIILQLDLLQHPRRGLQAAVFLRSKEFPKGKNTANSTFRFDYKLEVDNYIVTFVSSSVKQRLLKDSLPPWLKRHPQRLNCVLVGDDIDVALIHKLILLADFAGQCAHQRNIIRDPVSFYPPKHPISL